MRSEKASPFTGMGGIDTQTLSRMISTRSHRRPSISQSQPQLRPSTSRSQPPSRPGTSGSGSDSIPPVPVIPGLGQPLVDLTPHFKEPPQFSKEGKGRGVHVPAAMVGNGYGLKLVDIAGGGEAARMSGEYDPREFRRTGTMGGRSIR